MEILDAVEFWHWWVLGLVLLMLEIPVFGSFYLLWLAASAGGVGLLLVFLPDTGWEYQLLAFAVLSLGTTMAWRGWQHRNPVPEDENTPNRRGAQYVGRILSLDEPTANGVGKVRIDDTFWKVATADGADLQAGSRIKVVGVDSTVLTVEAA